MILNLDMPWKFILKRGKNPLKTGEIGLEHYSGCYWTLEQWEGQKECNISSDACVELVEVFYF